MSGDDERVCYYKEIRDGRSESRVISSEPNASRRFPVATLGNLQSLDELNVEQQRMLVTTRLDAKMHYQPLHVGSAYWHPHRGVN